jgi:hypothetical protein
MGLMKSLEAMSQNYYVYTVTGIVSKKVNNKWEKITPKDSLSTSTFLRISSGGRIVLLDEENSSLYTLKTQAQGKVKDLLKGKENDVKKVSSQYFSFLLKRIGVADVKKSTHMQSVGAGYRDIDSLLIHTDSLKTDSCSNNKTWPIS